MPDRRGAWLAGLLLGAIGAATLWQRLTPNRDGAFTDESRETATA